MKVLRGWIICHNIRIRVKGSEYRKRDYGWTRTEPVDKLLQELGLEIKGQTTIQVIPIGNDIEIVWRAE